MESGLQSLNRSRLIGNWTEQVAACRNSGLTVTEWCRQNHLPISTYYKRQSAVSKSAESSTFVELPVKQPGRAVVTVRMECGEADIYPGADPELITYPKKFLKGFKGYLQADGYAGYNALEDTVHVGCWAHARRKFHEASLVSGKGLGHSMASSALTYCAQLFYLEEQWKDLAPEERKARRQKESKPILDAFYAWANTRAAAPKSKIGGALTYLKSQWTYLCNYLLDGRLEISNNRAERSIKPFVISRKNFLFANTPSGAVSSAVLFSFLETAKENGLDPYRYLTWVLEEAPLRSHTQLDWGKNPHPRIRPGFLPSR